MEKKIKFLIVRKVKHDIVNYLNNTGGTNRSISSFKANKIIFLIAKIDHRIVGCIPLEPRKILLNKKIINSFFITNAFISKKFQNIGIGSRLIKEYKKVFSLPLFAFRLIREDQATNWYKKNGFKNIYNICSYELNTIKLKRYNKLKKNEIKYFKKIKINKNNIKKVLNILKYRKSNFILNNKNLYFNNYYNNYFKNMLIYYFKNNDKFYFITITLTNIGDGLLRYEILDNNLDYTKLLKFLIFFRKSRNINRENKYPIRLKINDNLKMKKKMKKFFDKSKYNSNLLSNFRIKKKNNFYFNSIEYV